MKMFNQDNLRRLCQIPPRFFFPDSAKPELESTYALLEMAGCMFCSGSDAPLHPKAAVSCPMTEGEPCVPCAKLKRLEAQILEAKKALNDLLEEHRATRSEINATHDPIIHRVPFEIASSIYQWCLPVVPPEGILSIEAKELAAPLVLGAVCRYWRKIAWSTPQLWSLIAISAGETSDLVIPLEISREWLSRSGLLPLSIGIRVSGQEDNNFPDFASLNTLYSLFGLVNQHSSRWHMLDIRVPGFLTFHFCGSWKDPPILRSLRLSDTEGYRHEQKAFNVHDLHPSVEELFLDFFSLQLLKIEWSRTIRITLVNMQPNDCIEIFRLAPQLRFCEIKNVQQAIRDSDIVTHNQLQHLVLDGKDPFARSFLRSVEFPALEILECRSRFPADHISSMLRRSSCFLKKLTINVSELEQDAFISFLRTVPCLQHIEVHVTKGKAQSPDALLRLLATTSITNRHGQSTQDFLPALLYFAYHLPKSLQGFSWALVPRIFGRLSDPDNPRRRPLEKVILSFGLDEPKLDPRTYIDEKTLPHLLSLLDKGLYLSIYTGSPEMNLDLIRLSAEYHEMGTDESSDDDDPLLMSDQ